MYLAALSGCLVFYWAYREWLSWIFLMTAVILPWLSLLLSLPAMLQCRVEVLCPEAVTVGTQVSLSYAGKCPLPVPGIKGKVLVEKNLTGRKWKLHLDSALPTEHCGALEILPGRLWVCDYLGLFCLRVRKKDGHVLTVRPAPLAMENPPDMSRYLANAFKPKPGGGFSENHELRLYRPGDNLHQVHWKLSAKTGKLILREPMEAMRGLALLTMELSGDPNELDRKLGRLRWLSGYLIQKEVPHQIHCLTGRGMEYHSVANEGDVLAALDALLRAPAADRSLEPSYIGASWRYHIGGDSHESR